ncbi:DUF3043 domain-containing protein [Gleimia sp. 6138-11-ORH1]|uniref:DUF3043 domain-containing protein n=1 Tax=Gleimia sp. 6138-11-ORH1 TaxID=2973937 RepID=UPI00216AB1CE|nr:DUF3043 domain-containing protein [Gleimia sp. 6138-11-ORH1]MCS4484457.1 DUF3043 domain-containing protein [Gleimia sp. 6138-11-ORH1]
MSETTEPNTGKGRPTPKRKDAQARKRRDMIPADRKLAKKLARERQEELWRRQQEAMDSGDERYMPVRDKGKARRFIRDVIDARWSVAELVLPLMFLMIITMMVLAGLTTTLDPLLAARILDSITWVTYGFLLLSILETTFVYYRAKKLFAVLHPQEEWSKRSWFYAFSRMIMPRRWRQPKAQVERGHKFE